MRVLILDDNAANLRMMEAFIAAVGGCQSVSWAEPRLALADAAAQVPDLVIADYMMPEMDGIAFLRAFRALPDCADIPVIMVTAVGEREVRHAALQAGVNDYLTKPLDRAEFLARARNMLRLRAAIRAAEEARAAAEQANGAKSQFLAMMSHEMRTPLNGIIGIGELLVEDAQESAAPPRTAEGLERMVKSARHLLRLVDDILDLSRIEAGKLELQPEPIDLPALIRDTAAALRPQIDRAGNQLDIALDPPPPPLEADPLRVRQILFNLLGNAAKFTKDGTIRISAAARDGLIAITVSDSGIGFAADRAEALFEEFRQGDPSTTRRYGGSGLGLSISRKLARAMGGDITGTSAPGAGASFTLILPQAAQLAG